MTLPLMKLSQALASQLSDLEPLDGVTRIELNSLREALRSAVPRASFDAKPTRDHARLLEAAFAVGANGGAGNIAAQMLPLQNALPWTYHYESRPGEASLADRMAFAELVGPDGPLMAHAARVGFTLMMPDTLYPLHHHPAVELYWIIAGWARWIRQDVDAVVPPGGLVLHRSDEPHAMRTYDQPLLALWGWSGDIDSPAIYS